MSEIRAPGAMSVLLVEDDHDFAKLVMTLLDESPEFDFVVDHVSSISVARERVAEGFTSVLLDLGLPDSDGLRSVRDVIDADPEAAVVVLTAVTDQHIAQESLELGAQEFLVKQDVNGPLLIRTLRYAAERQRLVNQLRESKVREDREREMRRLERMSAEQQTLSVTSSVYGSGPLHERAPDRYEAAAQEYGRVLDAALEDRAFRGSDDPKEDLRALAQVLGFLGATPRDVVRMHAGVMRQRIQGANFERAQAYVEEGRVHVLELMGYVASYYRQRAMGQLSQRSAETTTTDQSTHPDQP